MAQLKDLIVTGPARFAGAVYGNLSGNAATATSATSATNDSAGQKINTTYIKALSISGKVITYTKGDGSTGTITTQDTNTHYTTHLYAGTSSGVANAATTNGNTYLILTDDSTARNRIKIAGSGATTVTSDANGVITISSTDTNTNTTYSAGTGLSLSGTTFNHKNSVTAATAQGDASKTLTFGGTFTIPTVTYDAQGHITAKGTTTMTMPANPNTDTHYTTHLYAGTSSGVANAATTNGNTYLIVTDNSTARNRVKITGSGATTVTSDANGVITISSTDTNTNTWRGVQDNLTSTATDQSLSANQGRVLKGLVDGKAAASHTHSYLPLAGGTMASDAQIIRAGYSTSWIGGRSRALLRLNTISGYSPAISIKTTNGSWDIGAYDNPSYADKLVFSYCTDANFNVDNNSTTAQIMFNSDGSISGKISWDSVTGKPSSFTPASHSHDYLPLSGGTMSGNLTMGDTKTIILRAYEGYRAGIGYDTSGNECIALWAKNTVTRLRWYAGKDMSTVTAGTMMGITPDFEVSKASGSVVGYLAGNTIIHSGNYTTYCTPANIGAATSGHGHSVATQSANGFMSAADKTKLDHYAYAHLSTTAGGSSTNGYNKININSTIGWMLSFTIRIYQGYRAVDIQVSGYNYGSQYWYSPQAKIITDTSNGTMDIKFGYDAANKLWVAVPASDYYGITIFDVNNGYLQISDYSGLFTITYMATLTGTTQATVTAYSPWSRNETVTNSTQLGGLSASTSATKSTIVARDSNNYVFFNYINSNTSNSENPTISQIIVTNGSDSYYRKASLAHLKSSLGSMPASDVYAWAKASTKPSYTASEVGAAAASHTHSGYVATSGGAMTGALKVNCSNVGTDYTTYRFRNIGFGTTSTPTSDSTYGGNGAIYFMYS